VTDAPRIPVVFIHGLWLHSSSWQPWVDLFREKGYDATAPGWPGDSETVEETRAHADAVADYGVDAVADHYATYIKGLPSLPIVVGHSFGGLLVERLLGDGHARAGVAIDAAPIKGVLPLPISALRSASPVLSNPRNRGRAIPLTYDQFRYAFANTVGEDEAKALYEEFMVPAPGAPLFQAATANFNPWTEAKVDHDHPDRGPLLIVSGEHDHTVPPAIAKAVYKRQKDNPGVTEIVELPGRGHALVIDSGWREVADTALNFIRRFVS
jgi:non-heme chloroperoxidase